MGSTFSTNRSPFTQRDANNPKTFYLVIGGPKIKYIKEPVVNGPLIYNMSTTTDDAGPEKVEKAVTIRNYFRVSHKNGGIKLKPITTKNDFQKDGYELSFIIDGTPDMTCQVDVFIGAQVELKKGVGLTISKNARQGGVSQHHQYHICQQAGILADPGGLEFTCDEPIYLNHLAEPHLPSKVPTWTAPNLVGSGSGNNTSSKDKKQGEGAADEDKLSSFVPVVVQVTYMVDVFLSDQGEDEYGAQETTPVTSPSSRAHPQQQGQSFVTCLTFEPKKIIQRAKDNHSSKHASSTKRRGSTAGTDEHDSIQVTQTRNFLQLEGEVYEMNDIFDDAEGAVVVASKDDGADGGQDEDEEDDANLCVVCITERKNTVVLPCRHLCLCAECAAQIKHMKGTCPVCRGPIEKMMAR